ncbi:MAG: tRNA 2-thiouridine(34) synthase MnmA [Paludibacteraceae bacterium]|nr:tRNA 2-thiouridine(34) synthase MnmA [Paludibacteraceae bacterium]
MKRVVVGMSGGVDSSVAAYLLKEQGYDVVSLFMQNWHDKVGTLEGACTWEEDMEMAQLSSKRLGIPFHYVDLSEEYRHRVVDYMFSEYERGRTPNPDVLCNREIKFDAFLLKALELGADMVATGHYCRRDTVEVGGQPMQRLLAGSDPNKDQSYFLCQVNQHQLSQALFPIGHLLKPDVRRIAREQNLPTAVRKDSQGICFVGKVDLPVFLQQKLKSRQGNVVEVFPDYFDRTGQRQTDDLSIEQLAAPYRYTPDCGKIIGQHIGAQFYTIGQRKGLNIGGHKQPLFIIATDIESNTIYVGEGETPGLYRRALFIRQDEIHYIRPDQTLQVGDRRRYLVRIRYRQPLQQAELIRREEGLYILFDQAQRGISAGQFAAWYDGEELIGSGVINR